MALSRLRRPATTGLAIALSGTGIALAPVAFRGDEAAPVSPRGATAAVEQAVAVDPTVAAQIDVGGFPGGIAVGQGAVWVTQHDCPGTLVRIDSATNEIVAEISLPIFPMNVDVGYSEVWVSGDDCDGGSDPARVVRIDPATNEITATIPLPGYSGDIVTGEGGVWVAVGPGEPQGVELIRLDPDTNVLDARVPIGGGIEALVIGEGSVWVLAMAPGNDPRNYLTVLRVDPMTQRVVGRIPGALAIGVGEGSVWVSTWIAKWETGLRRVDAATLETLDVIERDFRAFSGKYHVGEGGVWFWAFPDRSASSAEGHARIYRLNPTSLEEDASVAPDPHRGWIDAALDTQTHTLWVSHYRDLVTRIDLR